MKHVLTLPAGRRFFTVTEALAMVAEASADPLTVVDIFVEVETDEAGHEHHPEGGRIEIRQRTSDAGAMWLNISAEAFPAACRELDIRPRHPKTRLSSTYTGTEAQNRTYIITADELTRYANAGGIEVRTAAPHQEAAAPHQGAGTKREQDIRPTEADTPPPGRQRHDDLALELERILAHRRKQGESTATHAVMDALRERAGRPDSCIAASVPEGVTWTRGTGKVETLTVQALKKRIKGI